MGAAGGGSGRGPRILAHDAHHSPPRVPHHPLSPLSRVQLAAWLVDPDKGGADDSLLNQFGLSAYDGLSDAK